ncbi:hypothetical protein AMTR_s00078p00194580 [Amborella trichopoda]|uniref:Fibronectin type-III domain-containing protein n=2 Tax=Amborella trichopoda TaxID=13333 RepID=W1P8I5_AMBTC|nr:hypothetical protein AMTR_s00078p00194580 [Amborella trichopoda]
MGSDEKTFAKESLSSEVLSSPGKKEVAQDGSKTQESIQAFLQSCSKKELAYRMRFEKERKQSSATKCKMTEQNLKPVFTKGSKNHENKKTSSGNAAPTNSQSLSRKQPRKGENPIRLPSVSDDSPSSGCPSSWICKNAACRANLTSEDAFCRRCSCCICHQFDDNKDPSLWLVCSSETSEGDVCGLSCHVECALQYRKVGVVDLGQLMHLDGSYCCASCGKVSGIIGTWKKQLLIAKDARRVDILCYRISLSHRLLDGTSRFQEIHKIVEDAKSKLETEVGPVHGVSAKMARGIVSRLSVASEVQKLCALAIEKAESWVTTIGHSNSIHREDSLPAACRVQFQDVTSSSLMIVLKDAASVLKSNIKGYKLWCHRSREQMNEKEPMCILPKSKRRVQLSNLQPCTEYTFRIRSFTDEGDLGHSESKCFTKSVEIVHRSTEPTVSLDDKTENLGIEGSSTNVKKEAKANGGASGFKVRDLGKILRVAWAQEQGCINGYFEEDKEQADGSKGDDIVKAEILDGDPSSVSHGLDLNMVSVPDLNAELTPLLDESRDEYIECSLEHGNEALGWSSERGGDKNGQERSNGSGDSQNWAVRPAREVPAVESRTDLRRKHVGNGNEETHDCDSTLINGSSPISFSEGSMGLDESYEYCVKIIRWLECEGHIERDFRMKFLTWFSLRSTAQERRVVNTFIQTLVDDPGSLAGQLMDSFLDIVSSKRPRNGFCSKLWH